MRVPLPLLLLPLLILPSCKNQESTQVQAMSFEEFTPIYNNYIQKWLEEEITRVDEELV